MGDLFAFVESQMAAELATQVAGDPGDAPRLSRQLQAVMDIMADGRWHTLNEMAAAVGATTQSVSARVRDMRKPFAGSNREAA